MNCHLALARDQTHRSANLRLRTQSGAIPFCSDVESRWYGALAPTRFLRSDQKIGSDPERGGPTAMTDQGKPEPRSSNSSSWNVPDFRPELAFPKLTEEMVERLRAYGQVETFPANVTL